MEIAPAQLAALVAIADHGTFEAAARHLHVTASAVSQRIRALESEVGQVVVRRTTPCRPTPAGEVLIRLARQTRLLHDEVRDALAHGHVGTVDLPVAVSADSLATWFRAALVDVADWSDVALRLHVEDQAFSADLLRSGDVLAAVTSEPSPVQGCSVEPLGHLRYVPAAAPRLVERWRRGRGLDWAAMPMVVFNEKDALQHDLLAARGVEVPPVVHRVPDVGRLPRGGLPRSRLGDDPAPAARTIGWCRSAPGCTSTSRSTGSAGASTRPCSTGSPTSYDGRRGPGYGDQVTAADVIDALEGQRSTEALAAVRKRLGPDEAAFGVRMKLLFDTARAHADLPIDEVHALLDHPAYEPRMAAFCILDFRARRRLTDDERRELYDVYLGRHDRITTWDMVDRAAPRVVGGYLSGRDLAPLHELAASPDPLRRRTAVTAPLFLVRYGSDADLTASLAVAAAICTDPDPVVHKAVGILLKYVGERDRPALLAFLDEHESSMPRPAVRLAREKLPE